MEKAYKNIGYFFIVLLAIVFMGFYKSYFGLFPAFDGVNAVKHFHGLMLLSWFILLIIQPFLINSKKYKLHRALGYFSYVLVPLINISIFLVSKEKFLRMASTVPREQNIGDLALNINSIFYFTLLFTLAMLYKNKPAYHMRYMIATALFIFGPGIGRPLVVYGGLSFSQSVVYAVIFTEIITIALIIYDIVNKKSYKPYLVTLVFLLLFHFMWNFRLTPVWQVLGGNFANFFFS